VVDGATTFSRTTLSSMTFSKMEIYGKFAYCLAFSSKFGRVRGANPGFFFSHLTAELNRGSSALLSQSLVTQGILLKVVSPNDIMARSAKANGREPKSYLGRVVNFKLSCFVMYAIAWHIQARPSLELKTWPRFRKPECHYA
jgi:hypothetical protein